MFEKILDPSQFIIRRGSWFDPEAPVFTITTKTGGDFDYNGHMTYGPGAAVYDSVREAKERLFEWVRAGGPVGPSEESMRADMEADNDVYNDVPVSNILYYYNM